MQNLLVLGIIPGTNIQITFFGWLVIALGFILLYIVGHFLIRHSHRLKAGLQAQFQQTINTNTALIGPIVLE